MDKDQPCLRVPAHRPIGTGLDAGRVFTVPTLESEVLSLHMDAGHGLRLLLDGCIKLFGEGSDFRPAPEFALMAPCASILVYH